MSKKKTYRSCEICGIREAHLKEPLFFANFPVDEIRCREWVKVTGNEDLVYLPIEKLHTSKHVCGHHFTKNDFNRKGNRLKKHVVPSINLNKPLSDDQLSEFPLHLWKPEVSAAVDEPSTSKAHTDTMLDPQTKRNTLSIAVAVDEPSTSKVHFDSILSPTKEENIVSIAASMDPVTQPSASEVLSDTTTIARVTGQVTKPLVTTSSASTILKSENSYGVKRKIEEKEVLTPRKKKLIEKLKNTTCTLKSLKRSALIVENIKSPVLKELILNACKNEKVKPRGRRWTLKHKLSCLAILKRSPKAYRYLSASLPLPTIKTLQNILKKIPIQPGICKPALNRIKKLAETQEDNDNIALLVFDEMAIKSRLIYDEANDVVEGFEDYGEYGRTNELADHALVFLLQGLKKKFKQPIAHYFTKGTVSSQKLAMLVKNIINEVTACGIRVMGIICDQGPTNMGAIKLLTKNNRSEEGGGHFFEIEDKRVYIIYDIPHLFKSIRNNFMNAGTIIMDKKKGNWELLKEVEIHNRNFLYLSKITESHVKPKYKAKMKVKLAAQLLSNTVAAVLKLLAMADTNRKEELLETAHIVQELDKLFDVSNGPSGPSDIKKTIRENVSKKTNHVIKWNESIQLLRNTKFVKNGEVCKNIKCIDGYIISLKSYKDIWNELQKSGLKYLNLRNLNQDGLENLFGIIRQSSPTNKNPTATHFSSSLKTAIITGMTAPHSRGEIVKKIRNVY